MERDLNKFYKSRSSWRKTDEETMRFKAAVCIADVQDGASVLDLGCRDGGLKSFLPKDINYKGMDIADEFRSEEIVIGDISKGLPFDGDYFDYIFAIEVCEHTTNPFRVFREVYRVLKSHGYFIISVPNPYHFKEVLWNLFNINDRQGHIFSWTRQAMTAFGETAGFRLVEMGGTYFHPPIPMKGLLSRSIVYKFSKASFEL